MKKDELSVAYTAVLISP